MEVNSNKMTTFKGDLSLQNNMNNSINKPSNTNQLQTTLQLLLESIEEQGRLKLVVDKLHQLLHEDSDTNINIDIDVIENNINENPNDKIKSLQFEMRRLVEQVYSENY